MYTFMQCCVYLRLVLSIKSMCLVLLIEVMFAHFQLVLVKGCVHNRNGETLLD